MFNVKLSTKFTSSISNQNGPFNGRQHDHNLGSCEAGQVTDITDSPEGAPQVIISRK